MPAHASNYGVELNGTYRVTSNGEFAKTNEVYIDEATVVQTWTMTTNCTSPIDCAGDVRSDQGWTAPIRLDGDLWVVERVIERWEPCPDGTSAPGSQRYSFWGWNAARSERNLKVVDLLVGFDTTKAPSGACGINKPLVIELPLRLEKLA